MIYLDDVADWTKSKTAKIVRIAGCVLFIGIGGIMALVATSKGNSLKADITANKTVIAGKADELDEIKAKVAGYSASISGDTYNPTTIGNFVATKQSAYSDVRQDDLPETVYKNKSAITDELTEYITGRNADKSEWYQTHGSYYTWYFGSTRTSLVEKMPVLWCCTARDNSTQNDGTIDITNVTAVATGVFNGADDTFSDITTYTTYFGEKVSYLEGRNNEFPNCGVGSILPNTCNSHCENKSEMWTQFRSILEGRDMTAELSDEFSNSDASVVTTDESESVENATENSESSDSTEESTDTVETKESTDSKDVGKSKNGGES